jgi:hypothetical protein
MKLAGWISSIQARCRLSHIRFFVAFLPETQQSVASHGDRQSPVVGDRVASLYHFIACRCRCSKSLPSPTPLSIKTRSM